MQVKELKELLKRSHRDGDNVSICVFRPGTIGGTPAVPLKSAYAGFDWDQGKFLLEPEAPVELVDSDVAARNEPRLPTVSTLALQQRLVDLLKNPKTNSDWNNAIRLFISDVRRGRVR
ncbi:hypothetical protein [Acidithiobacillus ferridurans]|uniref:Uncharacterized protein n=1 Tax=Acidithiobacillus ferridurans TaxID=1232575 RepID=A0A8X8K7E9_ACIFI|nr:hypothetical protein [Acidithiobacillus ferridurans]MBU2716959.1 hypothetical protein [Acidithiobacillus ferridurans]MBU2721806.1 hypothetical protein [Acidithiobacillus ferridurans]